MLPKNVQKESIVFNQKHCEAVANSRLAFPPTQKYHGIFYVLHGRSQGAQGSGSSS